MRRTLRRLWHRFLGTLAGRRRENDLAEELDSHIRLLADEYIRRGFDSEEASRKTKREYR